MGSDVFKVSELVERNILERPIDGNHGEIHPKGEDFVSSGVPFIMASDLVNGTVDMIGCSFISLEQASTLRKGFSVEGDVLLSHKATMGRTAVVPRLSTPYIILTPQVTYYRVKDPSSLNNRFLKYYFDSDSFQDLLSNWSGGGSTRSYLGITEQLRLPVLCPPVATQKAIAHILGTLDDKIELLRQMNETLETMARALFKSWFVDFDLVRKKADGLPTGLPKEIEDLFPSEFEDSELGDIPKGWRVQPVGAVLTELETGTRPKGGVGGIRSGIPSVGAENILGAGKYDFSKERFVSREFYSQMRRGKVHSEDVLLYKDGGKPGEFRPRVSLLGLGYPYDEFAINEHVFRMRSAILGQPFLYFSISSERVLWEMGERGGKAAIPGINQQELNSIMIVIPPVAVIEAFNKFAGSQLHRILRNAAESTSLSTIRDSLLPKLISGELELTDDMIAKILEPAK